MNIDAVQEFLSTTALDVVLKIAAAIAFCVVGRWMIGRVIALIQRGMTINHIDPTLTKYLGSIVAVTLNIVLVLGILGYFGIETTSFAALARRRGPRDRCGVERFARQFRRGRIHVDLAASEGR